MTLALLNLDTSWWANGLLLLDWVIRLGFALRVIMMPRGVGESLSWLSVILLLPFAGAAIYLVLGENRLGRARIDLARNIHPPYRHWLGRLESIEPLSSEAMPLACEAIQHQARSAVGIPALAGNRLTLLATAADALDAIIHDIDRAGHTCHLQFYIWFEGGTADQVAEALIRARRRGVECRVLLDSVGSKAFLDSDLAQRMRDAGVLIVEALPASLLRALFRRIDLRNHRKIIVIDHRIGYTGSLNMVDPRYFRRNAGVGLWIDAMVRIQGDAVKALAATFLEDWELETDEDVLHLKRGAADYLKENITPPIDPDAHDPRAQVQVVPSGPQMPAQSIHQLLLTAIYSARRQLILTTPYFVPDESLLIALSSAACRGVETTVIVPTNSDSRLARHASQAYYEELLGAGVNIAHFNDGLLHTKSVTADDHISVFGTVNLDMRSFYLNFEVSLLIYSRDFTHRLRDLQMDYLKRCTLVDPQRWADRPLGQRLVENTTRLLGPLL